MRIIWRYLVQNKLLLYVIAAGLVVLGGTFTAALIYSRSNSKTDTQTTQTEQKSSTSTGQKKTTGGSASDKSSTTTDTNKKSGSTKSPTSSSTSSGTSSGGGASSGTSGSSSGTSYSGSSGSSGPGSPTPSYPSASSTGPSGCSSYTTYSSDLSVTTDGTVLNCIKLTGTLYVNANNVTVQNSILTGTSWWGIRYGNTKTNATGFRVLHSKLVTVLGAGPDSGGYDYGVAQEASGSMEVAYNDISGYKDGVTASNSAYIHDNYIHDLSEFSGAHSQGVYVYTGSQVKIDHNTIINSAPVSQATAAIYIAPDDGHQNDRLVTNNLLGGGAYVIYGGDSTATNIVVTNNQITTQVSSSGGYYGVVAYWQASNSGNVWSGNTWYNGASAGSIISP